MTSNKSLKANKKFLKLSAKAEQTLSAPPLHLFLLCADSSSAVKVHFSFFQQVASLWVQWSLIKIFIISQTTPLCYAVLSEVRALSVTPLWCLTAFEVFPTTNTKTSSVGLTQLVPVKKWVRECLCVSDRQRERAFTSSSHRRLQRFWFTSVADPGCFDSQKYLNIWDTCLISECCGPGRCEILINSTTERSVEL